MAFWCPRSSSLQRASSDVRCNSPHHPSHRCHHPAAGGSDDHDACDRGGRYNFQTRTTKEERARIACWMVGSCTSSSTVVGQLLASCSRGCREQGWNSSSGSRSHRHQLGRFRQGGWQEPDCSTWWGSEGQRTAGRESCRKDSDSRLQEAAGWAEEWMWSC